MFLEDKASQTTRSVVEESVDSADSLDSVVTSGGTSSLADGGSSSLSDGGGVGGMSNLFGGIDAGIAIAVVAVALIVTIVLFVALVKKKKAPRGRFLKWLREYLNFRSILIAGIIKFVYLFLATLLTIGSIVIMFQGKDETVLQAIIIGLVVLVAGNVILRVTMELTMAIIMLWENSSDIRAVLVKEEEKPDEPVKPEVPAEPEKPVESEAPQVAEEQVAEQPVAEQVAVEEVVVEQPVTPQAEAPVAGPQVGGQQVEPQQPGSQQPAA